MQVGARIDAGRLVRTFLIERARIVGMARVAQVDRAATREGEPMTAVAGGQHAIEHVDAAADRFQQILRRANAHQIARLVGGQRRCDLVDNAEHDLLRLADREPADRIAGKADADEGTGALGAQRRVVAALHDAEQGAARRRTLERALAALGPAQRQPHRAFHFGTRRGQLQAFVELHHDVGPEQILDFDRALRRERDHRAVDVRAERDAALVELAQLRQRHHLEPARVGQDRVRPVHERVQAAQRRDALGARPQHQVIGVAEQDVGAGRAHGRGVHALDGRLRADRHEGGRAHQPCAVAISPRRAAPSVASSLKPKS